MSIIILNRRGGHPLKFIVINARLTWYEFDVTTGEDGSQTTDPAASDPWFYDPESGIFGEELRIRFANPGFDHHTLVVLPKLNIAHESNRHAAHLNLGFSCGNALCVLKMNGD
ncbi:MAG: hypothetical protein BWY82_01957 [Verrucomicrobia bacterium ADurb.Bin474]|nr:MAG: hypothetical protein BWY82_01957 [Verrucomicrobia bacterium ADurb.Bin474]